MPSYQHKQHTVNTSLGISQALLPSPGFLLGFSSSMNEWMNASSHKEKITTNGNLDNIIRCRRKKNIIEYVFCRNSINHKLPQFPIYTVIVSSTYSSVTAMMIISNAQLLLNIILTLSANSESKLRCPSPNISACFISPIENSSSLLQLLQLGSYKIISKKEPTKSQVAIALSCYLPV